MIWFLHNKLLDYFKEDDIVELRKKMWHSYKNFIAEVKFIKGAFYANGYGLLNDWTEDALCEVKIIGNVFQNPELLKKKESKKTG